MENWITPFHVRVSRLILFGLLLWTPQLWAQAGPGSQFGIVGGLSVPDADNTNGQHMFGIKGSAFVNASTSLGGYYIVSTKEEGSGGRKFEYNIHGIEGAYRFQNNKGDTVLAFRAGVSKIHEDASGTPLIFSPYHYGLSVGYDYLFTSWFVMGFEGSYLHFERSRTTTGGTKYEEESFNLMSFLITLQFRL
jgi:hypothetical protein